MPTRVTIKPNWAGNIERSIKVGLLEMVTDIHRRAADRAPIETGALKNSGKIEPVTNGYKVKFGSSRVPYARRRHYENKKNPKTLGYLALAGESVARGNTAKYFRNKGL